MSELKLSDERKQAIRDIILRDPTTRLRWYEDIGNVVFNAMYDFPEKFDMDMDDQTKYSMKIGILVAYVMETTAIMIPAKADFLIESFENHILNEE